MASEEKLLSLIHTLVNGDEWPKLIDVRVVDDTVRLRLSVVDTISWFAGHFPDQAVLPGVVQVHWATQLAKITFKYYVGETPHFKAVNNVKFKTMILPNQIVELVLRYDESKSAVRFSYCAAEDEFSTGIIILS